MAGSHWVSYKATWSVQNPSLNVVGTVLLRRERQPRFAKWTGIAFGKQVVRCNMVASQKESADATMMENLVVREPNLVDDKLNELLTHLLKFMCNLDAHVDRELQGLGCSNRIIVSHDLSSQPRVAERKTSHSQSIPRLATTWVPQILLPATKQFVHESATCHDQLAIDTNIICTLPPVFMWNRTGLGRLADGSLCPSRATG